MKKWLWLVIVFGLIFWNVVDCLGFDVSSDNKYPYRIYIGNDRLVDWVDVRSVVYLFNGEFVILFEDESPIQKVYVDTNMLGEQFYWIVKKNSTWKFFDNGVNSRLHLVYPVIPKDQNPTLIYERKH